MAAGEMFDAGLILFVWSRSSDTVFLLEKFGEGRGTIGRTVTRSKLCVSFGVYVWLLEFLEKRKISFFLSRFLSFRDSVPYSENLTTRRINWVYISVVEWKEIESGLSRELVKYPETFSPPIIIPPNFLEFTVLRGLLPPPGISENSFVTERDKRGRTREKKTVYTVS